MKEDCADPESVDFCLPGRAVRLAVFALPILISEPGQRVVQSGSRAVDSVACRAAPMPNDTQPGER